MGLIHPGPAPKTPKATKKLISRVCKERMMEFFLFIGDHAAQAARQMDCPVQNLYGWKVNGRISPKGALLIQKTWPKTRFKAEYLRPDIVDWREIEKRKSAVGRY